MTDKWTRRDGTTIPYSEMDRHHAWNSARMLVRHGWPIPYALADRVGEVGRLRALYYHAWNLGWLLLHPHLITWCMVKGL